MTARIILTLFALVLYVLLFNIYIFNLTRINLTASKLFYNYLTAGMIAFFLLDWKSGFVNKYHEHFNFICILCVIVNYVIIILTHHTVLHANKPIQAFYAFNGGVFAVTVLIVINFIKHGYHRN